MIEAQHKDSAMEEVDTYNPPKSDASVLLDRAKVEQLCQIYELYRKAHDHPTAFELAYGIAIEGLPF